MLINTKRLVSHFKVATYICHGFNHFYIDNGQKIGLVLGSQPVALVRQAFFCFNHFGGESGIRTHGTLLEYTRFPSVLLKPLGHLSNDVVVKGAQN